MADLFQDQGKKIMTPQPFGYQEVVTPKCPKYLGVATPWFPKYRGVVLKVQ